MEVVMIGEIQGNMAMTQGMMMPRREDIFAKIDRNGDGQIERTKMQAMLDEMNSITGQSMSVDDDDRFAQADTNGDGVLGQEEFEAMKPPPPPEDFQKNFMYQSNLENVSYNSVGTLLDTLS
jgi:Ca2+-binding EF-hand superfamily protein